MEILLWLVPPAVVTLLAMAWVSWLGREGRGEVDRDEAVRRMSKAMSKEHPGTRHPRPVAPRDRSTGIAVRPSVRLWADQSNGRSKSRSGQQPTRRAG